MLSFALLLSSCKDEKGKTTEPKTTESTTEETTAFYGEETTLLTLSNIAQGELVLVNKHYSFNPDTIKNLSTVRTSKTSSYQAKDYTIKNTFGTISALNKMFDAFFGEKGEKSAQVTSGFRTIADQQAIADKNPQEVDVFIARAGYSEHHTGLAVDLNVYKDGKTYDLWYFSEYEWIYENAHKYGFILRYTPEKVGLTGYESEPWHFRYVGVPHATYMYENNLCLEEYIELVKDYSHSNPLTINAEGVQYIVYYVAEGTGEGTQVPVYKNTSYTVSGNNVDGYIVTATAKN